MSDVPSPRQVAAQWFQRLRDEHDGSVIAELMAPDCRAELEGGHVPHGPGEFAGFYDSLLDTFPDMSVRIMDLSEEGDFGVAALGDGCSPHNFPVSYLTSSSNSAILLR